MYNLCFLRVRTEALRAFFKVIGKQCFHLLGFVTESVQDSVWDAVSCSVVPVSRCTWCP